MSFRNRLSVFFVLLVILPVLALAAVGLAIVRASADERANARLEQGRTAAEDLYRDAQGRARSLGRAIVDDRRFAAAVRAGERGALADRLDALTRGAGSVRVRFLPVDGAPIDAGEGAEPIAPAMVDVARADGGAAGELRLSVTTAKAYSELLAGVTGMDVVVTAGDRQLHGTIRTGSPVPAQGEATVGGTDYRVAGIGAPGFDGGALMIHVLAQAQGLGATTSDDAPAIGLLLLAFLVCASVFALTAARSLEAQTGRLLAAAHAIGQGDRAVKVPTEGNDEFAALGNEFNAMARQLERRHEELNLERKRLQETVRRVGESLVKAHDRDALLKIVVETAVDGVDAEGGRVTLRQDGNGTLAEAARAGDLSGHGAVMQTVEAAVLQSGHAVEETGGGAHALASPLRGGDAEAGVLGVIAIARGEPPFSDSQRELFAYLAGQAAISLENVDLHEAIQRQALTDELTGLFNHRRFQEVIAGEVERSKRFDQELGLIMIDLDDFKQVNDTYGHLQGDLVLRAVARVLLESSREIDEPARYGGEEMAVALPQTGLEGAYEYAERVRKCIEALELPMVDGSGTLRVTASCGVAALPDSAPPDKDALVAAADAALYEAKRAGKNRTVRAE